LEKKKRFALTYAAGKVYPPGPNNWAFVRKIKGGYEVLANPVACKDYIHEAIANKVLNKRRFIGAYTNPDTPINMEKFQIAMFYNNGKDNFKTNLYSIKKYINSLEKAAHIPQTSILEVDSGYKDLRAFVITADKAYIESPGLHHALVAMMRTLHYARKNITRSNIIKEINSTRYKDYEVLSFVLKHKVYDILLNNHSKITKLGLEQVYPGKVDNILRGDPINTYHSGFGMVAICSRKIASKAYANEVIKMLKENKVPIYQGG
jgi:hypothetical protein